MNTMNPCIRGIKCERDAELAQWARGNEYGAGMILGEHDSAYAEQLVTSMYGWAALIREQIVEIP